MFENIDFERDIFFKKMAEKFLPLKIVLLKTDNIPDILSIQDLCMGNLKKKEWCVPLSLKEYQGIIQEKGFILGLKAEDKIVAFSAAYYPGNSKDNLGLELGIRGEELHSVCHKEITFVHPEYRGQNLQYYLGLMLLEILIHGKKAKHFFTTVHPDNIASLHNNINLGHLVRITPMYGGLIRFVLYRDLLKPFIPVEKSSQKIDLSDLEKQKELLNKGWRGVALVKEKGSYYIIYCTGENCNDK